MRRVTYSLGASADGFVMATDRSFDFGAPDEEQFAFHIDQIKQVGVHLLGRRVYETMRYWEDPAQEASFGDLEWEWARLWRALPKVVFSRTLKQVEGSSTRLATRDLATEIDALREGKGDIAIGGAELAHQAAELELIDEYQLRLHPALVGDGTPFFARGDCRVQLALTQSRVFSAGVVFLRYAVVR